MGYRPTCKRIDCWSFEWIYDMSYEQLIELQKIAYNSSCFRPIIMLKQLLRVGNIFNSKLK